MSNELVVVKDDMPEFQSLSGITKGHKQDIIAYSIMWNISERSWMMEYNKRFTSYDVVIKAEEKTECYGDGSSWEFSRDTVQPDITAYELARILSIKLTIADGLMEQFKSEPNVMRHFQHILKDGFVA